MDYVSDSMVFEMEYPATKQFEHIMQDINNNYLKKVIRWRGKKKLQEMLGLFFGKTQMSEDDSDSDDEDDKTKKDKKKKEEEEPEEEEDFGDEGNTEADEEDQE